MRVIIQTPARNDVHSTHAVHHTVYGGYICSVNDGNAVIEFNHTIAYTRMDCVCICAKSNPNHIDEPAITIAVAIAVAIATTINRRWVSINDNSIHSSRNQCSRTGWTGVEHQR